MSFDHAEFEESVATRLENLSEGKRLAFGLWAIELLRRRFQAYLQVRAGFADAARIDEWLGSMWAHVTKGEPRPGRQPIDRVLDDVDWSQADTPDEEQAESFGALGIMDLLARLRDVTQGGPSSRLAEMATVLIDQAGYDVEMKLGEDAFVPLHPHVAEQLDEIEQALSILESTRGVPDTFREFGRHS